MRPLLALMLLIFSGAGHAYIGPGAGVSLLGSVLAMLVGTVLTIAAILFWPFRYYLRRIRRRTKQADLAPPPAE